MKKDPQARWAWGHLHGIRAYESQQLSNPGNYEVVGSRIARSDLEGDSLVASIINGSHSALGILTTSSHIRASGSIATTSRIGQNQGDS